MWQQVTGLCPAQSFIADLKGGRRRGFVLSVGTSRGGLGMGGEGLCSLALHTLSYLSCGQAWGPQPLHVWGTLG